MRAAAVVVSRICASVIDAFINNDHHDENEASTSIIYADFFVVRYLRLLSEQHAIHRNYCATKLWCAQCKLCTSSKGTSSSSRSERNSLRLDADINFCYVVVLSVQRITAEVWTAAQKLGTSSGVRSIIYTKKYHAASSYSLHGAWMRELEGRLLFILARRIYYIDRTLLIKLFYDRFCCLLAQHHRAFRTVILARHHSTTSRRA